MDRFAIVLTTVGSPEQASTLARALVEQRLAACVNITPVRSVYRWKEEILEDEERLLVIKTRADLFPEVRSAIGALHSYELPEIVMVAIDDGDADYLKWLASGTAPQP